MPYATTFEATLALGPFDHPPDEQDRQKAMDEITRVTGGYGVDPGQIGTAGHLLYLARLDSLSEDRQSIP